MSSQTFTEMTLWALLTKHICYNSNSVWSRSTQFQVICFWLHKFTGNKLLRKQRFRKVISILLERICLIRKLQRKTPVDFVLTVAYVLPCISSQSKPTEVNHEKVWSIKIFVQLLKSKMRERHIGCTHYNS